VQPTISSYSSHFPIHGRLNRSRPSTAGKRRPHLTNIQYGLYNMPMLSYKLLYASRKERGLCVHCGNTPPVEREVLCQRCKKKASHYRANLTKKERERRARLHHEYFLRNREKFNQNAARYRAKRKRDVFGFYGYKCNCCGETEPAFLTIDHVHGGGNKQRREMFGSNSGGGNRMLALIIKQGYPATFQVLCWNCNMAKSHRGSCPHKALKNCESTME